LPSSFTNIVLPDTPGKRCKRTSGVLPTNASMVGKSILTSKLMIQVNSRLRWRAWGGYSTCDHPPCEHPVVKLI
jgi:hypothetical protein